MILDYYTELSNGQALTATAVSESVLDLDNDDNIGKGEPMGVAVTVAVAADYTTEDETYQFTLQTSSDDLTFTDLISTGAINGEDLKAGKVVVVPLGHVNDRYVRMNYTLAGTSPSITVNANLLPLSSIPSWEAHTSGFTI